MLISMCKRDIQRRTEVFERRVRRLVVAQHNRQSTLQRVAQASHDPIVGSATQKDRVTQGQFPKSR
jgi:hypothetical protein